MALLQRLRWRLRMLRYALTLPPITGADEPEGKPEGEPPEDKPEGKPEGEPEGEPGEPVKPEDDWKAKARKHERDLKRERKARQEAEERLKSREDADKSEQEKAIEAARQEGEKKAREAADKERRGDRLEVAVTRLAAKGIELGEGEDAKTVRFADAEDALLRIERKLARGDLDSEDIFDSEGKVNTDALSGALAEIASTNPHLVPGDGERPKPKGDPDARKGDPAQKDLESLTPEDHAKRKYGAK